MTLLLSLHRNSVPLIDLDDREPADELRYARGG